jgi:hypothetical protein
MAETITAAAPASAVFRPASPKGALLGFAVAGACLLVAALLLYRGLQMETELTQIGPFIASTCFAVLAGLFGYWSWGRQTLRYTVDRNTLSIRWGGLEQIVPIGSIERLIPASKDEDVAVEGVNWAGHHFGRAAIEGFGDVLFYSGHSSVEEVLYVYTLAQTYAISVPDHHAFAQSVQASQARGPLFEQRQALHRAGISAQTFWADNFALVLAGLLVAAFFVVLGYVLQTYPDLAQTVALRFPSFGGIARLSDKSALLDIPRTAAGIAAINLAMAIVTHSWERMVSYVVLIAGILIQVVLLVAAIVAVA